MNFLLKVIVASVVGAAIGVGVQEIVTRYKRKKTDGGEHATGAAAVTDNDYTEAVKLAQAQVTPVNNPEDTASGTGSANPLALAPENLDPALSAIEAAPTYAVGLNTINDTQGYNDAPFVPSSVNYESRDK